MDALVIADMDGAGLSVLGLGVPPPLIPIAGRPLIEFTFDELSRAGVRRAVVAVSRCPEVFRELFGDGSRWGVELEFMLTRGEEDARRLEARCVRRLGPTFLSLRADVLRDTAALPRFLQAHAGGGAERASAAPDDPGLRVAGGAGEACGPVDIGTAVAVRDPEGLLTAALGVASERFGPLDLPLARAGNGVRMGNNAEVPESCIAGPGVLVGRSARVHPGARLGEGALVSDEAFVDAGAEIRSSVVMPGTYVGCGMLLENCIAVGDRVFRPSAGTVQIDEESWLAALPGTRADWEVVPLAQKAAALLLLAALSPLLLAAEVLARAGLLSVRRPLLLANAAANGSRSVFPARRYGAGPRALRMLPGLMDVLAGRLRLVGARAAASRPSLRAAVSADEAVPFGLLSFAFGLGLDARSARLKEAEIWRRRAGRER